MALWDFFRQRAAGVPEEAGGWLNEAPDRSPVLNWREELKILRENSPSYEKLIAENELREGSDLDHGLRHLALLLALDPGETDWLTLAKHYYRACRNDLSHFFPNDDRRYASVEALRALFLFMSDDYLGALSLLTDIAEASPRSLYLNAWALVWLESDSDLDLLPQDVGLALFTCAFKQFSESAESAPAQRRLIERWARLLERVAAHWERKDHLKIMLAGFWRKAGNIDKALEIIGALEEETNWQYLCAAGAAYRAKGDWENAIAAFSRAADLEPEENSAILDIIDCCIESEEWRNGIIWCKQVLSRDPDHEWALPSLYYCRWKKDGASKWLDKLLFLARDEENDRARELWNKISPDPAEPEDAIANVLRQIRDNFLNESPERRSFNGGSVSLRVSCIEAPSNFLAFSLEMEALEIDATLNVAVAAIPDPDPRKPFRDHVDFLLWRYEGTNPHPALPAPAPMIVDAIQCIALEPYDVAIDWAKAGFLAERFGPNAIPDILSTMVHPPLLPDGASSLSWVPRIQAIAAMAIAQIDSGWEGSCRLPALTSLLFGPSDWTTVAAISALGHIAEKEPRWASDILALFAELETYRPDVGRCCWLAPLYRRWMQLPCIFESEREELQGKIRRLR